MPGCARREIVRQGEAGIYHCWARCVRRAWLMGNDPYTGKDYTHRREWVIDRLQLLVRCFAIDVGSFAILSNHLHLVLRANPRLVKRWGDQEVARRWLQVYPGKRVIDGRWIEPTQQQVEELCRDKAKLKKIRKRLANISWFMASLSEYIARRANHEDKVTGRFWQGRFECRELTNERALLVCGAYVDLNQIRAGEVLTPADCCYSSIGLRLQAGQEGVSWLAPLTLSETDLGDQSCTTGQRASDKGLLPISLDAYVDILTWTAQQTDLPADRPIPAATEQTLENLQIVSAQWLDTVQHFPDRFRRVVGSAAELAQRAASMGRRWLHGVRRAAQVFR